MRVALFVIRDDFVVCVVSSLSLNSLFFIHRHRNIRRKQDMISFLFIAHIWYLHKNIVILFGWTASETDMCVIAQPKG